MFVCPAGEKCKATVLTVPFNIIIYFSEHLNIICLQSESIV